MTVQELIDVLQRCPPKASVRMFVSWEDQRDVADVSVEDADGFVVLGERLPAEKFARDFKDD